VGGDMVLEKVMAHFVGRGARVIIVTNTIVMRKRMKNIKL
jgi:hypothetical protein